MILLYGDGISNQAVKKYLDVKNIKYEIEDSGKIYDFIIKSPGILKEKIKAKGEIITDVEYYYRELKPEIIGITGTNGKTTTTLLINHLLKDDLKVSLGGNIGIPVFTNLDNDIKLIELSSFQLECTYKFRPKVAIILNIHSAHLDYHKTFEAYQASKMKIINNSSYNDYIIYNLDDNDIVINNTKSKTYSFSYQNKLADIYFENGYLKTKKYEFKVKNLSKTDILNVMPAILTALIYNISPSKIELKLATFVKPSFRMERIAKNIYNDAKSTNITSTLESIKELKEVVLIAGGYDRGEDLSEIKKLHPYLKEVFLYGANQERLEPYFGGIKITREKRLEDCIKHLNLNDIILYSPMAPSYDQFNNFEERGHLFNSIIKKNLENKL